MVVPFSSLPNQPRIAYRLPNNKNPTWLPLQGIAEVTMRALRALLGSNRVMLAAAVAVLGMQSPGVQAQSPDVFTHEIRPIMERTCWNCHSDQIQSSGLNLSTREGALQGGSRGPAIVPGRAEESRLYRQLTGIEGPLMPL